VGDVPSKRIVFKHFCERVGKRAIFPWDFILEYAHRGTRTPKGSRLEFGGLELRAVPAARQRLDQLLVSRALFESREKAQRAIMAGSVKVGEVIVDKPGTKVPEDAVVSVKEADRYVGRGGFKLEAALREFQIDPAGFTCLDIGASTGGFTDCLLQHGAAKVHAIDVGHSQLDWKIRSDPRVVVREKLNARYLTRDMIGESIDLCVVDVSFISLKLILPPALGLVRPDGVIVPLIKPQFELRQQEVGRGVVRDPALHARAVESIRLFVEANPALQWSGCIESPILGGQGNKEFLACLRVVSA
jgi:23S rRNA (cytidine1920-2'-O)/16S rRNA (cytidine1409-2'-O)-methyltransferase